MTDREQQTNLPGVYAAGDICVKQLRQVVTAVSDGAVAATSLERYLGNLYRRLGLRRTYARKKVVKEEKTAPKAVAGAFLDDAMREASLVLRSLSSSEYRVTALCLQTKQKVWYGNLPAFQIHFPMKW